MRPERRFKPEMDGGLTAASWIINSPPHYLRTAVFLSKRAGPPQYLPHPYVVPGGRFNEMYGWDSFFIQMGLLRDGELGLARDLANNALYEVREYGKVVNANRTYYLTRSQPPFLASMALAVYNRTKDRKWLEDSRPWIENYYRFW